MARVSIPTDGAKIRQLRVENGYSVTRLAATARISTSHLSRIENGHRDASPEVLGRIAKVFRAKLTSLQPAA